MLQRILNDNISGSSVLLDKTLDYLASLVASGKPLPEGALDKLRQRHSGMACFVRLTGFFSQNRLSASSLETFRRQIFREERESLAAFRELFPGNIARVAVFSHSGMVLKALDSLDRELTVDVALCGPDGEGLSMARALAGIPGIHPVLWGDGAYFSQVVNTGAIVLGCDALSPNWFVNRSGSGALVSLAKGAEIPVYLVPGPLKFLADELLLQLPLKQGRPLLNEVADGVDCRNPMLELIGAEGIIVSSSV